MCRGWQGQAVPVQSGCSRVCCVPGGGVGDICSEDTVGRYLDLWGSP